ncbi:MAG: pyruvoyl-dependent arginine decarboxylase [Nocardioides sp.]
MSAPDHLLPGPDITLRTGTGSGSTRLSAFDAALHAAGVSGFNLIVLSSVIPPRSTLRRTGDRHPGQHGDRLYCVLSAAYAEQPGEVAYAGLGWVVDPERGGLFVEHAADSEEALDKLVDLTLADMEERRGTTYGPVQRATAVARCVEQPVCAVSVAAYAAVPWSTP